MNFPKSDPPYIHHCPNEIYPLPKITPLSQRTPSKLTPTNFSNSIRQNAKSFVTLKRTGKKKRKSKNLAFYFSLRFPRLILSPASKKIARMIYKTDIYARVAPNTPGLGQSREISLSLSEKLERKPSWM